MQKVIAGWQEYYRAYYKDDFYQAFVMGKDSVEIDDFKQRETGFRIELDDSWFDGRVENIGILTAAYEQTLEFVDKYYLPPIVHLVVEQENMLADVAFLQSGIFKMFADLGIEEFHIDVMKDPIKLDEELETMGEAGKNTDRLTRESFIKIHYYEGKKNGCC